MNPAHHEGRSRAPNVAAHVHSRAQPVPHAAQALLLVTLLAVFGCTESSRGSEASGHVATPPSRKPIAHTGAVTPFPQPTPIGATTCGPFGALELDAAVPLLDDRLRIRALPDMRNEAGPHDIMAAGTPSADETRLVLEQDDARIVVFAYETRARAPADFVPAARTSLAVSNEWPEWDLTPVSVDAPSLTVAAFVPGAPRADTSLAPVLLAVVMPLDQHPVGVGIYVTPGIHAPGCTELARKLLQTVVPGPRVLDVTEREVVLSGVIRARIPSGWSYSMHDGHDFKVHYVERIDPLGMGAAVAIGVYVGGYPQDRPAPTDTMEGTLFGRSVTWGIARRVKFTKADTIVTLPDERVAHVWVGGPDDASARALCAMAEQFTLVR